MQDIKKALTLSLMYMRQKDEELRTLKTQVEIVEDVVTALIVSLKPQGEEFRKAMEKAVLSKKTALAEMEAAHRKQMQIMKTMTEVWTDLAIPSDLTRQ
jgi:hypothetical protein